MPMYEFQCVACSAVTEEIVSDRNTREIECPECKEVSKKIMSAAGWDIKGGGVYRHNPPDSVGTSTPKQGHKRISYGNKNDG